MISQSTEDYLKAIYQLGADGEIVTTSALAEALHVSAASATNMIKKLAAMKLARHSPYRGVELTKAGETIALEVIRHHRLVETFLAESLGVPWDRVHVEAEKIEHVLSEELEDRIASYLGEPSEDPHGDPIPSKAGIVAEPPHASLADVAAGRSAVIRRVSDQNPEHLRHFSDLGLVPNASVDVVHREPFGGPLRVRVGSGAEQTLDSILARESWVDSPRGRRKKPKRKSTSIKRPGTARAAKRPVKLGGTKWK